MVFLVKTKDTWRNNWKERILHNNFPIKPNKMKRGRQKAQNNI
uniref:Uncharacterized protein n=1 Tax=Rhizophora mucronata TaxID=61149 RepID=A0A2P2QKE0_RHIMU